LRLLVPAEAALESPLPTAQTRDATKKNIALSFSRIVAQSKAHCFLFHSPCRILQPLLYLSVANAKRQRHFDSQASLENSTFAAAN
jgi:hypothetical protein